MQENAKPMQTKQTTFIWWDGKQTSLDSFRDLCFPNESKKKGESK